MKSHHPPICMLQREGAERRCENMRIASSNVAMASSHQETKFSYKQSMTMEAAASKNLAGAIFTKSEEMDGADYRTSMLEYKKQQEQEAAQKRKENEERWSGPRAQIGPTEADAWKCLISTRSNWR